MASSGSDQIQDSLSCGVCFERFNSSNHLPKFLPCQHTLCTSCIDNLIGNSLTLDGFDCPVCRCKVTSDEIRTNLGVRDITEAVLAKEKAKLFCPTHPAKECQLVCVECCQLLCAVCMIKAEHVGHTIDDMDDAKVKMKKRLTSAIETIIANLEKATAAKIDKLTHYEQELNAIVFMINESLNEWKKTQLQTAQQAIEKDMENDKARQEFWKEKLQVPDLQSMMTGYKLAVAEGNSATDVLLPDASRNINLDEMRSKLNSLCDTVQTLITSNAALSSSSPPLTPSSPKDTDVNNISWDFITHLCCFVAPQQDPSSYPYIPQCVQRVANMYDRNRNRQFLRVVHYKGKNKDSLLCRTDDFLCEYDCREKKHEHFVNGLWDISVDEEIGFTEKWRDVLHDPEYAAKIKNALDHWKFTLPEMRNGIPELWWEIQE